MVCTIGSRRDGIQRRNKTRDAFKHKGAMAWRRKIMVKVYRLRMRDIGGKTFQDFYFSTLKKARRKQQTLDKLIKMDIKIERIKIDD